MFAIRRNDCQLKPVDRLVWSQEVANADLERLVWSLDAAFLGGALKAMALPNADISVSNRMSATLYSLRSRAAKSTTTHRERERERERERVLREALVRASEDARKTNAATGLQHTTQRTTLKISRMLADKCAAVHGASVFGVPVQDARMTLAYIVAGVNTSRVSARAPQVSLI